MRPLRIIEDEVARQTGACLADTVVSAQIDLLVFDRTPHPLDENIVPPGAAPIHANRDRVLYQQSRESGAAELAALDALLKVKLFISAAGVPLPGTPRLQGTNATTSAGTAVPGLPRWVHRNLPPP